MDNETKRLSEAVEAGLRDGRTLESLRKAMQESGYDEEDVKRIVSGVDRKKIVRKPSKKKQNIPWAAMAITALAAAVLISFVILNQQPVKPVGNANQNGTVFYGENPGNFPNLTPPAGSRTCYVVNESVKEMMIEAGAQCDKWYLIKEI